MLLQNTYSLVLFDIFSKKLKVEESPKNWAVYHGLSWLIINFPPGNCGVPVSYHQYLCCMSFFWLAQATFFNRSFALLVQNSMEVFPCLIVYMSIPVFKQFSLVVTGTMEFFDFPFSWEFHHPN